MTIALTMIVKNEAPSIAITLESARAALGPGPTFILDTGSTDATIEEIKRWAHTTHRECVIAVRPFDDFASSRNAALAGAWKMAPLACMVDAGVVVTGSLDATIQGGKYLPLAPPYAWAMTATIRLGSLQYERPQIFPVGWRYVGRVHEYAEGPPSHDRVNRLCSSGLTFSYELRDTARAERWLRDLALLEDDFTPRGRFYYAQTLELIGRRSQAVKAYLDRADMLDGYWQERVVALIRCIPLARNRSEAERYAQAALAIDGSRGEAWLELCRWADDARDWAWLKHCADQAILNVPRQGALFVDIDREWRANVYAGDAESSRGNFEGARRYWRRALKIEGGRMGENDRAELRLGIMQAGPSVIM